jgi:hypothetical protein
LSPNAPKVPPSSAPNTVSSDVVVCRATLRLPYETVRRHADEMVRGGICVRAGRRVTSRRQGPKADCDRWITRRRPTEDSITVASMKKKISRRNPERITRDAKKT